MSATYGTPKWLSGLLVIFAGSTAATLGLFLYRHAEASQLAQEHLRMQLLLPDLRAESARLEGLVAPLDQGIAMRKERLAQIAESNTANRTDMDGMGTRNAAQVKALRTSTRKELTSYGDALKEAKERRLEVGKEEERLATTEHENDGRRLQLREDVERQSQALEVARKKARSDNAALDRRIAELEDRVQQLSGQIDLSNRAFTPDGSILAAGDGHGHVVIDRGARQGLPRGTVFSVFTRRGGKVVVKGQVQVTVVEDGIATCRVIEERDANDPIIVGDQLHNPVYDPDRQRSFAVRGEFQRFTRAEIERFIAGAGGRVDAGLTVDTDYLVAGTSSDTDIELAGKLGVSVMSADQLGSMLQGRSGPDPLVWDYILRRCKDGATFGLAGDFTRADRGLIKRAISARGGSTSGGVSASYAALIVGDNALDEMAKARSLGVPVIDQDQFSRLARTE